MPIIRRRPPKRVTSVVACAPNDTVFAGRKATISKMRRTPRGGEAGNDVSYGKRATRGIRT